MLTFKCQPHQGTALRSRRTSYILRINCSTCCAIRIIISGRALPSSCMGTEPSIAG